MTETMTARPAQQDVTEEPTEARNTTTTLNSVEGDNTGVNAGNIYGSVRIVHPVTPEKPSVVDRIMSEQELISAREHFVTGPHFHEALAALRRHGLILLRGDGTGRSFTGIRLLLDHGANRIAYVSQRRSLDDIRAADLELDGGYLCEGAESRWRKSISANQVQRLAALARDCGAAIVVVLDDAVPVPSDLGRFEIRLGIPAPLRVATETLKRQQGVTTDEAESLLDEDFRELLSPELPPHRAELIADLAWAVHQGTKSKEEALIDGARELRDEVTDWYAQRRSTAEYAMAVAIAVFEHRTYYEVSRSAKVLEEMIDTADLPENQKPMPRKIFEYSRSALLSNLGAQVALRRHADDLALFEETVHFSRSRWATEAFRHVWREYDLIRPLIVRWMAKQSGGEFQWYCAKALHDVITTVPTHDPLEQVNELAGTRITDGNQLAVELMGRLAADPGTAAVVEPALRQWCESPGQFHRKSTAARVYGTDYGKLRCGAALDMLGKVVSEDDRLHSDVGTSVLSLASWPANRRTVLGRLVRWTRPFARAADDAQRRENLRAVGLDCAQLVLGLAPRGRYLRSLPSRVPDDAPGDPDAALVAVLFRRVLKDPRTRRTSVRTLLEFGARCAERPDSQIARGLVQLISTVAPNLHDQVAHRLFEDMCVDFPMYELRIDRLVDDLRWLQAHHSGDVHTVPPTADRRPVALTR